MQQFSSVEKHFFDQQSIKDQTSQIPYIVLDNFPQLGLITSLRFLEWAYENPEGIISLPTGKTPEYFIKWTHHILNNWNSKQVENIRKNIDYGANVIIHGNNVLESEKHVNKLVEKYDFVKIHPFDDYDVIYLSLIHI